MVAIVYHSIQRKFLLPEIARPIVSKDEYVKVCEVDTELFSVAFAKTQHERSAWVDNVGVTHLQPGNPERSTSVGDIIEIDGKPYCVDFDGFAPVTWKTSSSEAEEIVQALSGLKSFI